MAIELRPYQEATVSAAIEPTEAWRKLLVLATGAGKTVIAAEIINRVLASGQSALFLAHREELLTQAKAEIEGVVPDLHVELEQAENRATRERGIFDANRRHVVVGSVQTLRKKRLESWSPNTFSLVIIDEAHHSSARTYLDILEHFGCMSDERRIPLIGVTATPMRTDKVGLDVAFQKISASYNIRDLVEQGYLCDLAAISVHTDTDLRKIKMTAGDYNLRQLEQAVDGSDRNEAILAAYHQYAADRQTILFAAGVDHAQHLETIFLGGGVPTQAVWGDMGREERAEALDRYQRGETRVLTNFGILTEGFNAPQTSCIILGRPTKSELLTTQMIGRGTRLHEGKENCLVIDVCDVTNGKRLFSPASLAGLPPKFEVQKKSIFQAAHEYKTLEELAPHLAERALSSDDVHRYLAAIMERKRVEEVRLLRSNNRQSRPRTPQPGTSYQSPYLWYRRGAESYEISPDRGAHLYRVYHDAGRWVASMTWKGSQHRLIGEYESMYEAVYNADQRIAYRHLSTTLIERNAPWALEPPSEKQARYLRKLGLSVPETKGAAVQRITAATLRQNNLPVAA